MDEAYGVVYVDHADALGGAEHSLLALLARLDRSRYRPLLATVDGKLARAATELGVEVRIIAMPRLRNELAAPLRLARGTELLASTIREADARLVHCNTYRGAFYGLAASWVTGRPFVWHVRDIHHPGRTVSALCRRARAVVAISHAVAKPLPCADKLQVVYNPVRPPPSTGRERGELGLPTSGPLVASIGRLRPWKGHDAFLRAAARVRSSEARFLVIGGRIFDDSEPDVGPLLETAAQNLGIRDRTTFTGQRDDLASILAHLAVMVHAARAEPFGRVVAEAQCAGVPVVAFRDGGVPEIVADGETGLLVPPGDTEALAQAVDRLLSDANLRECMGQAARERATRLFDPDEHARRVESVYRAVLSGSRPPAAGRQAEQGL